VSPIELETCSSPLRWAGGKRKILPLLRKLLPAQIDRIVEPFFGGGSVSLGIRSKSAIGADTNAELVNFYKQISLDWRAVLDVVSSLPDSSETYYRIRDWSPAGDVDRAARFAYLNRTSYFGLYRTNRSGKYNVPYGGGGRLNLETLQTALGDLHAVLSRVSVQYGDYLELLSTVEAGDVVFLDPPYGAAGDLPFRRYGSLLFSPADHKRLAAEANRCRSEGASVFITLPPDGLLLSGYADWFIVGERRRGTRIVEVCATPTPIKAFDARPRGEWVQTCRSITLGQPLDLTATGT
jgi:DNA adenine methylase